MGDFTWVQGDWRSHFESTYGSDWEDKAEAAMASVYGSDWENGAEWTTVVNEESRAAVILDALQQLYPTASSTEYDTGDDGSWTDQSTSYEGGWEDSEAAEYEDASVGEVYADQPPDYSKPHPDEHYWDERSAATYSGDGGDEEGVIDEGGEEDDEFDASVEEASQSGELLSKPRPDGDDLPPGVEPVAVEYGSIETATVETYTDGGESEAAEYGSIETATVETYTDGGDDQNVVVERGSIETATVETYTDDEDGSATVESGSIETATVETYTDDGDDTDDGDEATEDDTDDDQSGQPQQPPQAQQPDWEIRTSLEVDANGRKYTVELGGLDELVDVMREAGGGDYRPKLTSFANDAKNKDGNITEQLRSQGGATVELRAWHTYTGDGRRILDVQIAGTYTISALDAENDVLLHELKRDQDLTTYTQVGGVVMLRPSDYSDPRYTLLRAYLEAESQGGIMTEGVITRRDHRLRRDSLDVKPIVGSDQEAFKAAIRRISQKSVTFVS